MKLKSLFCAAALALASPALAADLPTSVEPEAPMPLLWTGPYIGLHVGYGWGDVDGDYVIDGLVIVGGSDTYDIDGFIGGIQLGYNIQFDNFVLGVETDLSWTGMDGNSVPLIDGTVYSSSVDWLGTTRLRAGIAFDHALLYVTGGVAYGSVDHSVYNPVAMTTWETDDTEFGWALGAGVEFAVAQSWTVKAEYLYVDLGSQEVSFVQGITNQSYEFDTEIHTFRVGLNYRF